MPLAITLLVDNSRSMSGEPLRRARAAAADFIEQLRPDDLIEVVSFNDRVNIHYALGLDHSEARRSLDAMVATGTTGLYDAVLVALRGIEHRRRARTADYRGALIVLSDGDDTSSRLPFDGVLDELRRSGVMVYTISLRVGRHMRSSAPPWPMSSLAFESGGRALAIHDLTGLTRTYAEIRGELIDLYRIGYTPSSDVHDGSWRKVSVRVPGTSFVARTRSGYYASGSSFVPPDSSVHSERLSR
jgi:Ca-activated chloride channel family protein